MANVEILKTEKGKRKLSENGFLYNHNRNSESAAGLSFWVCEKRGQCNARVHFYDGRITDRKNEHTHGPDTDRVEIVKSVNEIKDRAASTMEPPQQILARSVPGTEGARARMPAARTLKRSAQRERNRGENAPPLPADRAVLDCMLLLYCIVRFQYYFHNFKLG